MHWIHAVRPRKAPFRPVYSMKRYRGKGFSPFSTDAALLQKFLIHGSSGHDDGSSSRRLVKTTSTLGLRRQSLQDENTRQYSHFRHFSTMSAQISSPKHPPAGVMTEDELGKFRENKKQRGLRRVATQSIPFWLKREPFCFERTVQALNLNVSADRWKSAESLMSDLPEQYKKAFSDSIPSFVEYLVKSDNLPPALEEALDRLVEAGFSDPEFTKDYRSVKANQLLHAQTTALIQQKTRSLEEREATVRQIADNIQKMEAELEKLIKRKENFQREEEQNGADNGAYDKGKSGATDSVISLVTPSMRAALASEHQLLVMNQGIDRLKRQIEGRKKHIESHMLGCQTTKESIENLKAQQNSLRSRISTVGYEEVQQVVREVLLVLCDALADHIQNRHSSLIERYQKLDSRTGKTHLVSPLDYLG
jgi:prefoldin subunit 5